MSENNFKTSFQEIKNKLKLLKVIPDDIYDIRQNYQAIQQLIEDLSNLNPPKEIENEFIEILNEAANLYENYLTKIDELENAIDTEYVHKDLQRKANLYDINRFEKMSDIGLRIGFAVFIAVLLAAQTAAIIRFVYLNQKVFTNNNLTLIITSIIAQSYFLPSFVAKYLFKNEGVSLNASQGQEEKKFMGIGFDLKIYK